MKNVLENTQDIIMIQVTPCLIWFKLYLLVLLPWEVY